MSDLSPWVVVLAVVASGRAPRAAMEPGQELVPRAVLKLIIEHPALAPYFHPELPGRVPLVISDHLLAPGITPSRFGQSIRIIRDQDVGSQPHIRFLRFKVEGSRANALVEYKVEGVQAAFDLESVSPAWWKVVEAKVTQQ